MFATVPLGLAELRPLPAHPTSAATIGDVLDLQRATASLERELDLVERRILVLEAVTDPRCLEGRWVRSQLRFAREVTEGGLDPLRAVTLALLADAERAAAEKVSQARDAADIELRAASTPPPVPAGRTAFAGPPMDTGPVVLRGVETASSQLEKEQKQEEQAPDTDVEPNPFWQELTERDAARSGLSLVAPLTMVLGLVLLALALAILG